MALRTMDGRLVEEVKAEIAGALFDEYGGELKVKFTKQSIDPETGWARIVVKVKPEAWGR